MNLKKLIPLGVSEARKYAKRKGCRDGIIMDKRLKIMWIKRNKGKNKINSIALENKVLSKDFKNFDHNKIQEIYNLLVGPKIDEKYLNTINHLSPNQQASASLAWSKDPDCIKIFKQSLGTDPAKETKFLKQNISRETTNLNLLTNDKTDWRWEPIILNFKSAFMDPPKSLKLENATSSYRDLLNNGYQIESCLLMAVPKLSLSGLFLDKTLIKCSKHYRDHIETTLHDARRDIESKNYQLFKKESSQYGYGEFDHNFAPNIKNLIKSRPIRKIVDLGSGSGITAIELKRTFPEATVLGLEIDADRCKYADNLLQKLNFNDKSEENGIIKADATKETAQAHFKDADIIILNNLRMSGIDAGSVSERIFCNMNNQEVPTLVISSAILNCNSIKKRAETNSSQYKFSASETIKAFTGASWTSALIKIYLTKFEGDC